MADMNCSACEDIRQTSPEFIVNGLTDDICTSLQNDTGLNPNDDHNDCTDLHNLTDCLVGNEATEVEAYDVCDWKTFMKGGVWHKADKAKTFVLPYDVCSLMDCKGFEEYDPCATACGSGGCCDSCEDSKATKDMRDRCGCCCEGDLKPEMALCYHTNELQQFYGCDTPYQLVVRIISSVQG